MSNDQQPPRYPQSEGQFNPQYAQNSVGKPPTKPKKPIYKRVWFWIVIVIVVVAISIATGGSKGNEGQNSGSETAASAPATNASKQADKTAGKPDAKKAADAKKTDEDQVKGDLALLKGWKLSKDEFSAKVTGYVRNNSDEPINNYVQIEFNAYDASGNNLGTCVDNSNSIDAHGKWKVDAICLDGDASEIKTVKFKDLTGF
ncbi:FxLYD domain-containing protein [Cutibacterium sp.]|uniref:FxLYD domain-containing protein n=1 Tax=Cutibacterium sp. TaxID=1912221 RepID=UPI0026DD4478|nr:FxLYD domain-containing protein [Cutibacterium sp.]MDO4412786.1 FxLYD domain-containing protein [Cutibacterium sp.]